MPKLLIVTPGRGSSYNRIDKYLVPRFQNRFDQVIMESRGWGSPPPGDTQGVTHLFIAGPLEYLYSHASEVIQEDYPDALTYAWAGIDTPFVPHVYANVAQRFDFFVGMSSMAVAAYRNVLLDFGGKVPRKTFKAVFDARVIRPGVDRQTFRPLNNYHRQYSRAEIREALFNGLIDDQTLLLFCEYWSGRVPPLAMAITRRLRSQLERPVALYLSPRMRKVDGLAALAAGNELQPGRDLFVAGEEIKEPEKLNWAYNAADAYLCLDDRSDWPFELTEAMAAGCVVAAPADHVWLECIDQERGIELPADLMVEDPGSAEGYVRGILPGVSADLLSQAFSDGSYKKYRENAILWAADNRVGWDRCATEWLRLFGMS